MTRDGKRIVLYCILTGVLAWLLDSVLDALCFREGFPFLAALLPGVEEVADRLMVITVVSIAGVILWVLVLRARKTELILRQEKYLLETFLDHGNVAKCVLDSAGNLLHSNREFDMMLERREIGSSGGRYNILEDENLEEEGHRPLLERVFSHGEATTFITRDEQYSQTETRESASLSSRMFQVTVFPIMSKSGNVEHVVAQFEDVSESKKAEKAIKENSERFQTMFNLSRDCLAIIDSKGSLVWSNRAWDDLFSGEHATGFTGMSERIHPAELERFTSEWDAVCSGSGDMTNSEFRFRGESGRYEYLETSVRRMELGDRALIFFDGHNVTSRRKAETRLEEETERLRITLQSIGEGVIAAGRDGRITLLNRAAEELTGWSQQEALGRSLAEVFSLRESDGRPISLDEPEEILDSLNRSDIFSEYRLADSHGEQKTIGITASPIRGAGNRLRGLVLIIGDIGKQKRLVKEMQKSEKLESLGVLAGGIAHDFNNLLMAVMGNLELTGIFVEGNDKARESLARAKESILEAKRLTSRLLTFSRGGAPLKAESSVAELIDDCVSLAMSGSAIRRKIRIEPGLYMVEVDSDQISQALSSILINAVQALPVEGGEVRIDARNVTKQIGNNQKDMVVIEIADNGTGISEEHLHRIFDPFFTTKPDSTGLGLAVAYSIIRRHGGSLEVESEQDKGSTFRVFLPAAEVYESRPRMVADRDTPQRKLRILVMDDEEQVRRVIVQMLQILGHEVEDAPAGRETIEKYRRSREAGEPFDLVLLDLTVPGGMGGKETISELKEIDPEVTAVVTTGFSKDPILSEYSSNGFAGSLVKPFVMEEIKTLLAGIFG